MRSNLSSIRTAATIGSAYALLALTACGEGDRDAEAETPASEAEVTTELPEEVVSERQLESAANAAAEDAASPSAEEQMPPDEERTERNTAPATPVASKPVQEATPDPAEDEHADHHE